MFSIILEKIKTILEANELIQETFVFEVEKFNGTPSATIVPSSNESDYNTTDENMRIYAYNITLFVNRSKKSKKDADRILRNLVDSVIDDFDKDYTFSGIENPTGYTFINTFATPSLWGYSGREDEFRVCEISIRCRVSIDLNAIS